MVFSYLNVRQCARIGFPLLGLLSISACTTPRGQVRGDLPAEATKISKVDWYFDGTRSLQGFVKDHEDTNFVYLTREIESAIHTLVPAAMVSLHRFGMQSEPFTSLQEAWRPRFYSSSEPQFANTDLTSAIPNAIAKGSLTIVVTDLYPDESNFEPFRGKLIKAGLGQTFDFGIVACKADFDGMIYDIPPKGGALRFSKPRPVYVLLLGPKDTIAAIVEELQKRQSHIGAALSAAVFSSTLGKFKVTDFGDPKNDESIQFKASGFDPADGLIQGGKQNFARQLRLSRSAKQPKVTFEADVSLEPYEVAPADGWHLEREVRMCTVNSTSLFERVRNRKETNDASTSNLAECKAVGEDYEIVYPTTDEPPRFDRSQGKQHLVAPVTLDLGKRGDPSRDVRTRPGHIYIVKLKLSSNSTAVALPKWVSDFSQSRSVGFDGSRTTDLDPFLVTLGESLLSAKQAVAMKLDIYIDSK